jgi:hypothetical protein
MKNFRVRLPWVVLTAAVLVAGCSGGTSSSYGNSGSSNPAPSTPTPSPSPAPAPTPPPASGQPPTPTPSGQAYYFSDCQDDAHPDCVPGNNVNPGTDPAAPKRDLAGFNLNGLPAGSQVLFARGGTWTNFSAFVYNLNATASEPIFFDSYSPPWGGSARPRLRAGATFYGFQFGGTYGNTVVDGGYVVRNLKLEGVGAAGSWGVFIGSATRSIFIEHMEITNFAIAIHMQNGSGDGNRGVTIRHNDIALNTSMGILGDALDLVIEGNTFRNNNYVTGSGFEHAIYLGGHGTNGVVRGNVFVDNSVVGGVCTGGNLTVHGQWDGLLIENNLITQAASDGGCYGISINSAYDTAEWFRNLVVRGNTIVNLGNCSICLTSAPGAIVENNVIVNTQNRYHAAILIPDRTPQAGDDLDSGAIVRNNSIYLTQPSAGDAIRLTAGAGSNLQVVSNLIYFGAGASSTHSCFAHPAYANFAAFDNNLCHHAGGNGRWSASYATLANAQAAGFDIDGLSSDPLTVVPSNTNDWSMALAAGSPAIGAAHPTLSATQDKLSVPRTDPDIGAFERQ